VRQITKNIPIAQKNIGFEHFQCLNEAKNKSKPQSELHIWGLL